MQASVIIPTRDRAPLLADCLARLQRQSLAPNAYEIIVVDDASPNDATARLIASMRGQEPELRLVRRTTRGWPAAARNDGIAAARGEVLVFVDDDAFVGPRFLERHLALHRDGRPAIVAGGIVQVRAIPDVIEGVSWASGYHRHPLPGGNGSAPTWAVRLVGGYDAQFTRYGWHDQELAERLRRLGLRRRFAWNAAILHYKPPAYDVDLRAQIDRERERGRMGARFYYKHPRWTVGITTKVAPSVFALVAALARLLGIDRLCQRLERGELDGGLVAPWRAAVLRARVESTAGALELARLTTTAALEGAARRR